MLLEIERRKTPRTGPKLRDVFTVAWLREQQLREQFEREQAQSGHKPAPSTTDTTETPSNG